MGWKPTGGGGTDADAIHDNVTGEIAAITEKASPVSADLILIEDSEASNAKKRVQIGNLPSSGGGLPWFDVTDYGATGDGSTDDTSDINDAIAALNSAGQGVLYFPAGTYRVTSALTTITASGMVTGDGPGGFYGGTPGTLINQESATANLFTVTGYRVTFRDLALVNTAGSTPSAGAGIAVAGATGLERVDYEHISVAGFYDCVSQDGCTGWTMHNCWISAPHRYGVRVRNTQINDAGDWNISDTGIFAADHDADAGIRIESSGGGKISNVKINASVTLSNRFDYGIDLNAGSGVQTSILMMSNLSIENVREDAFRAVQSGSGFWNYLMFSNYQVGLYSNNTGRAINLSAATLGNLEHIVVDGYTFMTNGTARAAVSLTKINALVFGEGSLDGNFNALVTSSGSTNISQSGNDHGGLDGLLDDDHSQYSRADGTRAFTGTVSGVTPTASAHLATKGYVDSNAGRYEVIVSGSAPPVAVTNEAEDDWLYGLVT